MATDIKRALRKYLPHLQKAKADNLNEADTVQRLVKVFEEVLGWDAMSEITRESQIKDRYVDIAIKLEGKTVLLIEAKAAGVTLRDRHIEQAEHYAAQGNIPWVLLTNGTEWTLFHLTFEEGIESVKAFSVNLETDDFDKAACCLGLLHRNAIRNEELEEFWTHRVALSPESVAKALFHQDVLMFIRREIRRSEGILIDVEDLAGAIHDMMSVESREQIGPVKIRKKRKARAKANGSPEDAGGVSSVESAGGVALIPDGEPVP